MLKLTLIVAILSISSAAKCQDSSRSDKTEIIDPVINDSFSLIRKQNDILVSHAVRGKTNEGFALIDVTVSPKNKIVTYKIAKLKLIIDNVKLIDFYLDVYRHTIRGKNNPRILSVIKPQISHYVFNKITILRHDSKKSNRDFEFLIRMQ